MKPEQLKDIKVFMLDLDGTFYLGPKIFDWSFDFIDTLAQVGSDFIFLTNNSSNSRSSYVEKIRRMGMEVPPEKIITSGEATTIHLSKIAPKARVYVVGTPALEREFEDAGFVLDETNPEYVVLGFDTTLTYAKLVKLCDFVREGRPYLATHPDFNCPVENGFIPDIGGMMALVEACTGRRPDKIIGKPYEFIVEAVLDKLKLDKRHLAMVGDRLYTDIAMGVNSGITSILVLSGETTMEDVEKSEIKPDFIFENLGSIAEILKK